MFFVRPPFFIKIFFPYIICNFSRSDKKIYLTFDDGVNEKTTPFILENLKKFEVKASFFLIAKNVLKYPFLFEEIKKQGHQIGNHTFDHLDAWKTSNDIFIENIEKANKILKTKLFRPPYGRLKPSQIKFLSKKNYKIFYWDVLSGDYSNKLTKFKILENVINNTKNGSIIVFHDNLKAEKNLKFVLPKILEFFKEKNFLFATLK